MKNLTIVILLLLSTCLSFGQTAHDLFNASSEEVRWLGIDFSKVKLVGGFAQFSGAGEKGGLDIKETYFPAWNTLILNEPKKYDLKGMIRKENLVIDIDMIMAHNAKTNIEDLETYNPVKYSEEDIQKFVREYNITNKSGIGILFIAESLNKIGTEGVFHFVAIRNSDKTILVQERMVGKPSGFGIRNYWAGSIYNVIEQIKKTQYKNWKSKYSN